MNDSDADRCAVCQEDPTDPRILPCGNRHLFCLQPCLTQLIDHHRQQLNNNNNNNANRNQFPCPLCRNVVTIPPGGPEAFEPAPHAKARPGARMVYQVISLDQQIQAFHDMQKRRGKLGKKAPERPNNPPNWQHYRQQGQHPRLRVEVRMRPLSGQRGSGQQPDRPGHAPRQRSAQAPPRSAQLQNEDQYHGAHTRSPQHSPIPQRVPTPQRIRTPPIRTPQRIQTAEETPTPRQSHTPQQVPTPPREIQTPQTPQQESQEEDRPGDTNQPQPDRLPGEEPTAAEQLRMITLQQVEAERRSLEERRLREEHQREEDRRLMEQIRLQELQQREEERKREEEKRLLNLRQIEQERRQLEERRILALQQTEEDRRSAEQLRFLEQQRFRQHQHQQLQQQQQQQQQAEARGNRRDETEPGTPEDRLMALQMQLFEMERGARAARPRHRAAPPRPRAGPRRTTTSKACTVM